MKTVVGRVDACGRHASAWCWALVLVVCGSTMRPAEAAIGRSPGSAGVTPTGEASYVIPIRVTPGIAGLTPELAVAHVSAGTRGFMGAGFAVTGLSAITPCARTLAQDGVAAPITLTTSDVYCVDGQRLRLISGTYGANNARYRTEIDRAMRVTSFATSGRQPTWFRIERANGLIYDYGNTADSRMRSSSSANAVTFGWALNRIVDRAGNTVTFRYQSVPDSQVFRPDYIEYTGTAATPAGEYRVVFVYQAVDRPDPVEQSTPSSSEAATLEERKLLSRIELRYLGATYRQYLLTYQTAANAISRLASIRECAATTSDCLSPTTFTWQNATPGYDVAATTAATVSLPAWPLDFNGDGFEDLVWAQAGTWRTMVGGAGGYGAPVNTGVAAVNAAKALPLEWNGDGRADLLVDASDGLWRVLRGTASGLAAPVAAGPGGVPSDPASSWTVADLNGDGRDDLVRASATPRRFYSRLNSATGFTSEGIYSLELVFAPAPSAFPASVHGTTDIRRVDFDNDGREDFLVQGCEWDIERKACVRATAWWVFFSNGTSLEIQGMLYLSKDGGTPVFGDFNADLLTDVVYRRTDGTIGIALSRGRAGFTHLGGPSAAGYVATDLRVADQDGDGYDDLLMASVPSGGSTWWYAFRGTGAGVSTSASATTVPGQNTVVADVDGDALPDLARVSANGTWTWHSRLGIPGNLIASATDGFGVTAAWTRAPMSSTTVYKRGSGAVYPVTDTGGTRPLVSRLRQTDGSGGTATFDLNYSYEAARLDLEGRGSLGFAARTLVDSRLNYDLELRETYSQAYPYVGLLATRTLKQQGGATLNDVVNTWGAVTFGTARVDERRLPYLEVSVIRDYSAGIVFRTTRRDIDAVDATSGLVLDATTTVTENATGIAAGATRTTRLQHTGVLDDTASWCIGRPTTSQLRVSHTSAGGAAIVRNYKQAWDASECRLTQQQLQPGDTKLQVTTSIGYDAFGNPSSEQVVGVGMPARTTTVDWGTRGQFPETIRNALLEASVTTWDPATGVPLTTTDPNQLITSWEYDAFGRLASETRPDGTSTTWSRSSCSTCDPRTRYQLVRRDLGADASVFRTSTSDVDRRERVFRTASELPFGSSTTASVDFDARGRVTARRAPAFVGGLEVGTWRYTYDELDRLRAEELQRPGGASERSTTYAYDGLQLRLADPLGHTTLATGSAWGQVVRVTDAANRSTSYEYNAFGQPTRIVDSLGNQVAAITYNASGMKTAQVDIDLGNWVFESNALGEVTRVRDAKTTSPNWTTVSSYDLLGRLTSRLDVPEGITARFVYGSSAAKRNIGQLESQSLSDGSYSEAFTYDSVGRLSRHRIVADTTYDFDYAYNAIGTLKTLLYPTSTAGYRLNVDYEYDRGYLTRIVDAGPTPETEIWRLTATDAAGRAIDERIGTNTQIVSSVDAAVGLLESRTSGVAGTTALQDLVYTWNQNDQLTSRVDGNQQGLTESFEYDSLGRLDRSRRNGVLNLDVAYDAIGNITSKFEDGLGTSAYQYHATRRHAVVSAGAGTFAYDANGNMTSRNQAAIGWYSYNLPRSIAAAGGNSSQFWYGPQRNRWRQVATSGAAQETTIYAGGLLEKVTKSGATTFRHYVPTPGSASALVVRSTSGTPASYYLLTDHLGSLDKIVNATGATISVAASYSAFGRRRGVNWTGSPTNAELTKLGSLTRDGYTGHEMLDGVGLVHMNGRVYDPAIGRFLSPDPHVPAPLDQQSLNRYSYVGNDPLSLTDPTGFSPDDGDKPYLVCDDGCGAWYSARFRFGYVPFWPYGDPTTPDFPGHYLPQPAGNTGVPLPPDPQLPFVPREPRAMPRVTPFTGLAADSSARVNPHLCMRAGVCTPQRPVDPADVVNFVAGVGDVLLGIASLSIVDGPEFRRVHDIGSVNQASNAYEAGFWGTVFASAGLGRLFTKPPAAVPATTVVGLDSSAVAAAASTRRAGTALSELRYTHPNEQFIRYESGNPAFSRVTPTGGVVPGTYAAPMSDGFVPVRLRGSAYNLPNPEIPRTNHFILSPPAGTAIIGPRPVAGGTGQEVLFPNGF